MQYIKATCHSDKMQAGCSILLQSVPALLQAGRMQAGAVNDDEGQAACVVPQAGIRGQAVPDAQLSVAVCSLGSPPCRTRELRR